MDGAMWGLLRACSCLCPCSKGLGLATRRNRHGMGEWRGETDEQRMKKEAGFKEGGRYKKGRHETTP